MAEVFDLWALDVSPIDTNLNNYSINLVGGDGSGKTSFMTALMNTMGKTFVCGFEDRFKSVPGIRVFMFEEWKEFIKMKSNIKKGLKQGKPLPFNCCNIDTVGEAAEMAKKYIMDINGWTELKGDQYNIVGRYITDEIRELRKLGFIVNFVSHEKDKEIISATGEKCRQTVPDAMNQVKHLTQGDVDFILYLQEIKTRDEEGEPLEFRRLWIHGHPMIKLKTALYGMPRYIDYDTVEDGVEKFIKAFNEGVKITQKMQDEGLDTSNPNADNNMIIENKKIITSDIDEDDNEDDNEDESVTEVAEKEPEVVKSNSIGDTPTNWEPAPENTTTSNNDLDIKELRKQAKVVRDELKEKMDIAEVKRIMKEMLGGTIQVAQVEDPSLLKAFIDKYKG